MGRPVGERILTAVAMVKEKGAMTTREMTDATGLPPQNAHKYLSRAVGLGLIGVNRKVRPILFFDLMVDDKEPLPEPIAPPEPRRIERHHLESVWG